MGVILFVAGCGSSNLNTKRVQQPVEKQIHEIDDLIIEAKDKYKDECYANVIDHEPPETTCEFKIFDAIERRYGLSYSDRHVKTVADELFFPQIFKKVHRLVKQDSFVRDRVRKNFNGREQLEKYYFTLYSFTKRD